MDLNFAVYIITKANYDSVCRQLGVRGAEAKYWLKDVYGYGTKKYPILEVRSARRKIAESRRDSNYQFNTLSVGMELDKANAIRTIEASSVG